MADLPDIPEVQLVRFAFLEKCVMGRLTAVDFRCWTVERPWLNNTPAISCIPDGDYYCKPFNGRKFKDVIEITNVPGRTYILFHPANLPEELQGCIAPGTYHSISEQHGRVWHSRDAMANIKRTVGREFFLSISSQDARLGSPASPWAV